MKQVFNPNQRSTIVFTHQELGDLLYVTEQHLLTMKAEGLEESEIYARLTKLQITFSGESD